MARTKTEIVKIAPEFGLHLIGRGMGARIRDTYFAGDPRTWPRVLDFDGVEQATESCIDELLGGIARKWEASSLRRIEIRRCSAVVRETIRFVQEVIENPPPAPDQEMVKRLLEQAQPKMGRRKPPEIRRNR